MIGPNARGRAVRWSGVTARRIAASSRSRCHAKRRSRATCTARSPAATPTVSIREITSRSSWSAVGHPWIHRRISDHRDV